MRLGTVGYNAYWSTHGSDEDYLSELRYAKDKEDDLSFWACI